MKTIKFDITNEIEIKNSKFITKIIKINENTDISKLIENAKEEYPKATHYCYAYRTSNYQKSSDDNEPSKTAGIPMLNVIEKNELINVLVITIRYFGGIKLGAGGLIRAYSSSVTKTLEKVPLIEIEKATTIELEISYDKQKDLEYICKNYELKYKEYDEKIKYVYKIPTTEINKLNKYDFKILNSNDLIEKKEV